MIAVKNGNSLRIIFEEVGNLITDLKEKIKSGTSMIFPKVAFDIFEFFFIDLPATEIDSNVFIIVIFCEELTYRVNRIAVKFFDPRSGECHGNDSISYVSKIKIKPILLVSVFWPANNFPQKVHVLNSLEFNKFMKIKLIDF